MVISGTLIHCKDAQKLIEQIDDPVTRNLVNMAFVHVVKTVFIDATDAPQGDFDMGFFVKVLEPFFAEHDVLARTLSGERVGSWFEDGAGQPL